MGGRGPRLLACAVAALLLAAAAVAALAGGDGSGVGDGDATTPRPAPSAEVRGCRERVEGPSLADGSSEGDVTIGPLEIPGIVPTWREYARRPDAEIEPLPEIGLPVLKLPVQLRAGRWITLEVPEDQRPWLRLVYEHPRRKGTSAITLRACRRVRSAAARRRECGPLPRRRVERRWYACKRPVTQFSGGFAVDFVGAPRRGECGALDAWSAEWRGPRRVQLFDPAPGACPTQR